MPALAPHASHARRAHSSQPAVVVRSQSRRRRQRLMLVSLTLGLVRRRAVRRSARLRSRNRSLGNSHMSRSARRSLASAPFRLARFASSIAITAAACTLRSGSPRRLRTAAFRICQRTPRYSCSPTARSIGAIRRSQSVFMAPCPEHPVRRIGEVLQAASSVGQRVGRWSWTARRSPRHCRGARPAQAI